MCGTIDPRHKYDEYLVLLAPGGNAPPPPPHPPVSLEQLLTSQNDLMRLRVENEMRRGPDCLQPQYQDQDSLYSDFLVTNPPVFTVVMDPLEEDNWLRMMESKFGLLQCKVYQKAM
jgi:hypothetical protein